MTKQTQFYFFLYFLFSFKICFSQVGIDNSNNKERIENEYKLKVPDSIANAVWDYLQERYNPQHSFIASITDSSYHIKFSTELFTDQYFDDDARSLQKKQDGIRHRIRKVLSDTTNKKNNRELIQVKLNSIDDNPLDRAEYKFPVKYYSIQDDSLNNLPFLGMVKKEKRSELIKLLKKHNIDAYTLLPAIQLIQMRRRVYIAKDTSDFATITLDEVSAELDKKTTHFTEIEFELNEITYTHANATAREAMEQINKKMKDDLEASFPAIVQDQTPKYNKAYALLMNSSKQTEEPNSVSSTFKYLIAILILSLLFIGFLMMRKSNP